MLPMVHGVELLPMVLGNGGAHPLRHRVYGHVVSCSHYAACMWCVKRAGGLSSDAIRRTRVERCMRHERTVQGLR